MNDCVGIDEAVDVELCWRAFVAGSIAGVCGMDCPFCVWLALHLAAGGGAHQCRFVGLTRSVNGQVPPVAIMASGL